MQVKLTGDYRAQLDQAITRYIELTDIHGDMDMREIESVKSLRDIIPKKKPKNGESMFKFIRRPIANFIMDHLVLPFAVGIVTGKIEKIEDAS